MIDYKQLCAELVAAWDELPWQYDWKGNLTGIDGYPPEDSAVDRARAALAKSEPEGPTEFEIASILLAYAVVEPQMGASRTLHENHFGNAARAILARWGRPTVKECLTVQPADGEVAELVDWLLASASYHDAVNDEEEAADSCRRIAFLLERLSPPQPTSVSERLPGPEDCDVEVLCWVWNTTAYTWGLFRLDLTAHSHWLPAHALPLPS